MDFHNLSLKEQLQGLKKGSFSSTELTSHYLERIEKYDDELNSFISILNFILFRFRLILLL